MDEPEISRSRRAGGRSARHAKREAPLAEDIRPVRMGMPGGQYRPLTDGDIGEIHAAALDVLESIGLAQATPGCIEACTRRGATLGEDGRLRFPRRLVEETIAGANRDFVLCGRDPAHDIKPHGANVHFGTAGAAVHLVDVEHNEYRDSRLRDIYDAARIADCQDNIHFFQRPMVARDIESTLDLDVNTLYACLAGTAKHVGISITEKANAAPVLELAYRVAGGEAAFRARPFVSCSICFVVPPLKFAEDACDVLQECVAGGMPILLLSAARQAPQRRRPLPARSFRRLPRFWPASCSSMRFLPGIRQYSEPAVCLRSAHRSDVGWLGRTGVADGSLRPDGELL